MQFWIADVRHTAFQLEEIDVSVDNEDIILVLTAGLTSHYDNLIVALDSVEPALLTLDTIISRLLNEDSHQFISAATNTMLASLAADNPRN